MRRIRIASASIAAVAVLGAAWLTFGLPDVNTLDARLRAPSSRIVDRRGVLLYEIVDPRSAEAGRQRPMPLSRMPAHLRAATIAVEDAGFYHNSGVDIFGILRAVWMGLRDGRIAAGGSTITQQLARQVFMNSDERTERTALRKLREMLLAWQLTLRYSKSEILETYLNEIYYGNLAYGVEAAARTYFGKGVDELDLAESALLAGLPQAPATYDPFLAYDRARERQSIVLDLMVRAGAITEREADEARQVRLRIAPAPFDIRAPHFVVFARAEAERLVGRARLLEGGLIITTTLDAEWQAGAEESVRLRLRDLARPSFDAPARDANNAAVVAVEPDGGAIRVMVGSPDYFDRASSGSVNAATALRQPGSAIKPVTYAAAFENAAGFTAATPILDVRTSFPTREGTPYVPVNYDRRNHGPIAVRSALATSNNVAAVQVLQQVGVSRMIAMANDLGLSSFNDGRAFGLALTLGGGEVRLLDLTAAYGAFAAEGRRVSPYAVSEIRDVRGMELYVHHVQSQPRVLDARIAWLISDILSDDAARAPAFGAHSVLDIGRPAAVKTGTTTDFRDNWTVGYAPQIAVGVWVGNADGSPMQHVSGVSGAGPIWNDVMHRVLRDAPVAAFTQPPEMTRVRVCALSGMLPSPDCLHLRYEWFLVGSEPTVADTWHRRENGRVVVDVPAAAREWARREGWPVAGDAVAQVDSPVMITQPYDGSIVRLDPALPMTVQRLAIEVHTQGGRLASIQVLDAAGRRIADFPASGGRTFWTPIVGEHIFIAYARRHDGTEIHSVPVRVVVKDGRRP
jgi:penicillin-binding protein 1C